MDQPLSTAGRRNSADEVAELHRRAVELGPVDPRQALALTEAALALADRLADPVLQAQARLERAHARRELGDHAAALADYEEARRRFRQLRRSAEAAGTAVGALDSLRFLGRSAEALALAAWARRIFRRHGLDLRAAALDANLGILYFQQDDYARALRLWTRARTAYAAAGLDDNVALLGSNAANALTQLDRLREAEQLYAAARTHYAARDAHAYVAGIDINLGYLAYRQGRYGVAVDTLRRAADAFDSLGHAPAAIVTRLDLAETYLALNLLDEAAALAADQLSLTRVHGLPYEGARAIFYLATAEGRGGLVDEAIHGLHEAERAFAGQRNQVWRARCALARAVLLLATGSASEGQQQAQALARGAGRVFDRLGMPSRQAGALVVQARAHLAIGAARPAERTARAALAIADHLAVPWLLFECRFMLGQALSAQGRSEDAYAAYRSAADALERVREELQPEELRVSLVADKVQVYQELVLLCLERAARGDARAQEEALLFAERAKSRALAERLASLPHASPDPAVVGPADAATLDRMRQLREELNWLYTRLGEEHEPTRSASRRSARAVAGSRSVARLRRETATREAELVRLHRRLQPASRDSSALATLATGEAGPALAALRQQLGSDRLVLEYFQAGDELVLFVIGPATLAVRRLGPAAEVAALVERFDFQVRKFNLGAEYLRAHADELEASVRDVLAELYGSLLQPAAADLRHARGLFVVPHGLLHYIPFHALLDPTGQPLADRLEVSYAPSASVLEACMRRPGLVGGPQRPLVMGVVAEDTPQVSAELAALRDLFGPRYVFSGEQATETTFRARAPHADVIHLASHAVFREDNPLFSALRLSDGWLSLYDLYGLRLRAALVALSACETGLSEVLAGDELVGLSRGFFQAGAASLVVSLWAVSDESTAVLMEHFYRGLRAGQSPAAAMRAAQQALRRTYRHPYYWAPFLVIGRP